MHSIQYNFGIILKEKCIKFIKIDRKYIYSVLKNVYKNVSQFQQKNIKHQKLTFVIIGTIIYN